jgi:lysophospholipase L1-like esterase
MPASPRPCETHLDLISFKYPLPHLTKSLKEQRNIRIVAIGSSSTASEGNILPYPARLELLLRDRFRDRVIDVINQGIGGQEASTELPRFQTDVIDQGPSMVIWQVGTNAVFRNQEFDFDKVVAAIAAGLDLLAKIPADAVLMDLQYVPAVVKPGKKELADKMVERISAMAEQAKVNVFHRYALMRRWQEVIPIQELIDPTDHDELHMSDWATGCVTQALFDAIKQVVEAEGGT